MKRSKAEILREYGPFAGVDSVGGVTYDNEHVWFASGDKLNAFDPASGNAVRSIDVAITPHPLIPKMRRHTFVCYTCNQTRTYMLPAE